MISSFFFFFIFFLLFSFHFFSVSHGRYSKPLACQPWYEQLRYWTTFFSSCSSFSPSLYCYRSLVLYEFHIFLANRYGLDEIIFENIIFTKKHTKQTIYLNTLTVFQYHRLLFINISYWFFFFFFRLFLLACLLFAHSFIVETLSSLFLFFVYNKLICTSSKMKKQIDEKNRQLSVNKMMNVRRR